MKPEAIVYTSNTGSTQAFSRLLAEETGLPLYSSKEAEGTLKPGTPIIYLGWILAGKIQGYPKAAARYVITALGAVGMSAPGSQMQDVTKANALPENLPLFTLQGGFDRTRLKGVYRLMMGFLSGTVVKQLEKKPVRTADEEEMLILFRQGSSRVSPAQLKGLVKWYREQAV